MASSSAKHWVTFDEDVEEKDSRFNYSKLWPISGVDDTKSTSYLPGSLSSVSSGTSFISTSFVDSRVSNYSEENSGYSAFKNKQTPQEETNQEDITEPSSSSCKSDCKYSVFSSLRLCEDKGEYMGWSKKVLGEGVMGWSETLRAKPSS